MTADQFAGRWVKVALYFLVFAAVAGIGLRYYNFSMITGLNYKHLLHAHSHIALLGWMFFAFAAVLVRVFLGDDFARFKRIFQLILVSVIGMMLSFPFEGYGPVSITFSTLFLFGSYWFVWLFLKLLRQKQDTSIAARWVKWSLFFLVISSFGPWSLGPIMVFGERYGTLYYLSIYYYLHFLYNGFFVLATFAIIMKRLSALKLHFDEPRARLFFQLTVYTVIPAYALSALWLKPAACVYVLGGLAAGLQLVALIIGWPMLREYFRSVDGRFYKTILAFVLTAYWLKEVMQFLSAIPVVAAYAYDTRVFTAIGYIHLVMLGFLTLYILVFFVETRLARDSRLVRWGLVIFLTGILWSELILFANGVRLYTAGAFLPNYALWMMIASALMPTGLIMYWIAQLRKSKAVTV